MIYRVELSEQADADLRGIFEYIAFELLSPENALGQLERLEQSIMGLDQMPERFQTYDSEPWKNYGLRKMPVDNYCVFYIPDKDNGVVTVIRVMYDGQNIDEQLKEYTKIS